MPTIKSQFAKRSHGSAHEYMVLGQSRMSKKLLASAQYFPVWQPGSSITPAFIAAEILTQAGFQCRVMDSLVEMHFCRSEQDTKLITSMPWLTHGVPPENGQHSDKAVVLIRDGNEAIIYDPALGALNNAKSPEFPTMLPAMLGCAHSNCLSIFSSRPRKAGYVGAMEWFLRAPRGGLVMVSWALLDCVPTWCSEAAAFKATASVMAAAVLSPVAANVSVSVTY
jgi:hypothetical protein